jgi:hypothetical protein
MDFPSQTVGHAILTDETLAGALVQVAPRAGWAGEKVEVGGKLRITSVGIGSWYDHLRIDALDEPHCHPLALVIDTEIVEGSFAGVEALVGSAGEITMQGGRGRKKSLRHRLRVDPARTWSGGSWAWSSVLFAPSDAGAAARMASLCDDPEAEAHVALRLVLAAMRPMDGTLLHWLLHEAPPLVCALPWAKATRVARDGQAYEVHLEGMDVDLLGPLAFAHKAQLKLLVSRGGQLVDVKEQEVFVGGPWWDMLALPPPADPTPAIERWSSALFGGIRAALEGAPEPRELMPWDLPLAPWLDPIVAEHVRNGPPPSRPRPVKPRHSIVTIELAPSDDRRLVAAFRAGDAVIRCELPNPWSVRFVLAEGDAGVTIYEVDSDGMNGTFRLIDGDAATLREVMRWLYGAALAAGDPFVTIPEEDDAIDEDDGFEPERKRLSELIGFTPEERLVDWRTIVDDFDQARDCATAVDEAGLRLWRSFLHAHFEPA